MTPIAYVGSMYNTWERRVSANNKDGAQVRFISAHNPARPANAAATTTTPKGMAVDALAPLPLPVPVVVVDDVSDEPVLEPLRLPLPLPLGAGVVPERLALPLADEGALDGALDRAPDEALLLLPVAEAELEMEPLNSGDVGGAGVAVDGSARSPMPQGFASPLGCVAFGAGRIAPPSEMEKRPVHWGESEPVEVNW